MQQDREATSDVTIRPNAPGRLFDPAGLLLVAVVGTGGILTLVKHVWTVGIPCVVLAVLGLIASHRHFDRVAEPD